VAWYTVTLLIAASIFRQKGRDILLKNPDYRTVKIKAAGLFKSHYLHANTHDVISRRQSYKYSPTGNLHSSRKLFVLYFVS
jgi:hypothetical protein